MKVVSPPTASHARNIDPGALLARPNRRVHDGLRFHAVNERWPARPLVQDGVDEFEVLVVAEGDHRISLPRIARGAGIDPEFLWHRNRLQVLPAQLSDTQLQRALRRVRDCSLGAVYLAHIL